MNDQGDLRPLPISYGHNLRLPYIDENIDDWIEDTIKINIEAYSKRRHRIG